MHAEPAREVTPQGAQSAPQPTLATHPFAEAEFDQPAAMSSTLGMSPPVTPPDDGNSGHTTPLNRPPRVDMAKLDLFPAVVQRASLPSPMWGQPASVGYASRSQVSSASTAVAHDQSTLAGQSITTLASPSQIQRAGQGLQQNSQVGGTKDTAAQDLDLLYADAAVAQKELYAIATDVASKTNGEAMLPGELKGRERATQKTLADYGGDASRLLDIARASVKYKTFEDLQKGFQVCQAKSPVVVKNRFENVDASGYRDVLMNLRMSNGHVVELQLHLDKILEAKKAGHKDYERVRSIKATAALENRALTADELVEIETITARMKGAYDTAFEQSK